ncbi:MAG: hypothetical protein DRJ35_07875, partial [Thermoprotei archaeon]
FSLSCYSPYFPDSCTLLFSKDGYTSKSLITSVKVRGVVDVATQYIYYVKRWAVVVRVEKYENYPYGALCSKINFY